MRPASHSTTGLGADRLTATQCRRRPGPKLLLIALATLLLAAPAAQADAEKTKALLADLAALRKASDGIGFQGELKNTVALHNELQDKSLRGKLQKELGAVLKSKKMKSAHKAIVKAISELNDSKGAFKQLKKLVPSPKEEDVPDLKIDVLHAVAQLAPDAALKQLFVLAEKAKHRPSGIAAIDALGHFGTSKKRTTVLEELIKLVMRFMPPRGQQVGVETQNRWNALAPPLINALNRLTGQKIRDPDEWITMWRDNKKRPNDLFQDG